MLRASYTSAEATLPSGPDYLMEVWPLHSRPTRELFFRPQHRRIVTSNSYGVAQALPPLSLLSPPLLLSEPLPPPEPLPLPEPFFALPGVGLSLPALANFA